jgi:hypothetical protein
MLLIWLAMALGYTVYSWYLVHRDELVAPREQVVLGSITAIHHGKSNTAYYSYEYGGREYHASEMVNPDQHFGHVAVYLDPESPSTSSLVEFRHKREQDTWMMHACSYASLALAAILAFVLELKRRKRLEHEADQATLHF